MKADNNGIKGAVVMHKPKPGEAWAFVAHKGDVWYGAAAGNMERKDLASFLGEFIADGYQITRCETRDEYEKFINALKTPRKMKTA